MISNEDYKDIKDSCENDLTVLYRYFTSTYGHVDAGLFSTKFKQWCFMNSKSPREATDNITHYLDLKHEYQGFIENWK
jgi:hypothetical protein